MKRLIYKIKRFFYSIKVRREIREHLKPWVKTSHQFQMRAYDIVHSCKGIKPIAGDNLDRIAESWFNTTRQEGETDEEMRKVLRQMIIERRGGEQ